MKKLSILFVLALFLSFGCRKSVPNPEVVHWEKQASNITIIRDDFGVPHIYGKTDADAVFGLLYAQCEDDFNRVEQNYIWATGRLAEVEGESALYSDVRAKLFMTEEEAIANYNRAPEWLRKLCDAFADGINYYLHTHPEVKPRLLTHFEPWMPMYFSEGSIGGDIERVSTQRIKAFYEQNESMALNEYRNGLAYPHPEEEPRGSNGFAIAGKLTESGNAMLLINPHTSFFFRGEVHVVSEEGLNAYGAVTWGQFFVYQGFNEKTGWMHTSTYTDVIDEFVEEVTEKEGGFVYKYGEEERAVESYPVSLKYKEEGELKEKTFTLHRTHHGPVTHSIDGKWVSTALMWEPVKALEQSYIRTKQDGHEAFREMMNIRTNSSNNTVYADAGGNIAYYHGNFIPRRDTRFNYREPVDGSNPATDWQGLHQVDESIVVVNPPNGWIQNCNSTPFTSAAENSPKVADYPIYMSLNRENFRGIHAIDLLEEAKDLNLDKLITLAYDPYIPGFAALIPGLIEAYDRNPSRNSQYTAAIDSLRNWNYRTSSNSIAMSLAHYYGSQYVYGTEGNPGGEAPDGLSFTERVQYFGSKSADEERLKMFDTAMENLIADFGKWQTPWGEINRYQRLTGAIRQQFDDNQASLPVGLASGRWGALASYGARKFPGTKRIYGYAGNSFVAVVEFGEKVKAKSMLAGGQSGDPNSPHFDDQSQRYIDVNFKDVAYYKEDVEKRAVKTYKPGNW